MKELKMGHPFIGGLLQSLRIQCPVWEQCRDHMQIKLRGLMALQSQRWTSPIHRGDRSLFEMISELHQDKIML